MKLNDVAGPLWLDWVFSAVLVFETIDGPILLPFDPFEAKLYPSWSERMADLAILPLANDVPTAIPRYALYGRGDEIGKPVVLAGYGLTGHGATGETEDSQFTGPAKRAGRNRYEDVGRTFVRTRMRDTRVDAGSSKA